MTESGVNNKNQFKTSLGVWLSLKIVWRLRDLQLYTNNFTNLHHYHYYYADINIKPLKLDKQLSNIVIPKHALIINFGTFPCGGWDFGF